MPKYKLCFDRNVTIQAKDINDAIKQGDKLVREGEGFRVVEISLTKEEIEEQIEMAWFYGLNS